LFRFSISLTDWYLFIRETPAAIDLGPYGVAEKLEGLPLQVYVEDSRYLHICEDKYGRIGKEEFFCPECYDPENDEFFDENYYRKHNGKCFQAQGKKGCGGDLYETAYVWKDNSHIKGRFHKEEIIHGRIDPQLPHTHGIPKTVAALRPARILMHIDRMMLENAATGKVKKLVVFKGMQQNRVNQLHKDIQYQTEEHAKKSLVTGQRAPPVNQMPFIGLDDPNAGVETVEGMPDSESMQLLEWYKIYVERVCGIFGVSPKFEGIAEAGKPGLRMKIDVDNDTARMYQRNLEEKFEQELWPKLGVTEWAWLFDPIEPRDELLDARIKPEFTSEAEKLTSPEASAMGEKSLMRGTSYIVTPVARGSGSNASHRHDSTGEEKTD
jgi:hypothetical protein